MKDPSFLRIMANHRHLGTIDIDEMLKEVAPLRQNPGRPASWFSDSSGKTRYNDTRWIAAKGNTVEISTAFLAADEIGKMVPYVALLACRKRGTDQAKEPRPDSNFTFFRATGECGDFTPVPATMGRFLVGLPEKALPDQAFGAPLKDGETRRHTHPNLEVNIPEAAFLSWIPYQGDQEPAVGGALRSQGYSFSIEPAEGGIDIPYIQLSHCRPLPVGATEP